MFYSWDCESKLRMYGSAEEKLEKKVFDKLFYTCKLVDCDSWEIGVAAESNGSEGVPHFIRCDKVSGSWW